MTETPLLAIPAGADVQPWELEAAVERVLRPHLSPGDPGLSGPAALQVRVEGRAVHVGYLAARTRSGLAFEVEDEWLVLPPPGTDPVVRVGLGWELVPVADGSAVRCGRPALRLLAPGEAGADGELVLAADRGDEPTLVPVPGDRLDGCAATAAWAGEVDALLAEVDRRTACLTSRLGRTGAPVLAWGWLLQPVWAALGTARGFSPTARPDALIAAARRGLVAVAELPVRATLLGDGPLADLFARLPAPPSAPAPAAFHDRCGAVIDGLAAVVGWLGRLLEAVGAGLRALPELLYHGGQLYRKEAAVGARDAAGVGPTTVRHLTGPAGRANLAVLWDAADRVLLGDVRFAPPARPGSPVGREEVYLGNLPPGADFHWLPDVAVAGGRLETPRALSLLDAATYAPLTHHPERTTP